MNTMKENDGRGQRRRYVRRIIVLTTVVLFIVFLLFRGDDSSSSTSPVHRSRRARLGDAVAAMGVALDEKHRHRQQRHNNNLQPGHVSDQHSSSEATLLNDILLGKVHLVGLQTVHHMALTDAPDGSYAGLVGEFCRVDWSLHKKDPAAVGIFRFLLDRSPDCKNNNRRRMDLKEVVEKARIFDEENKATTPKLLDLTAVAFHESRCGSTLISNMAVAADADKHRVYSESHPPVEAMRNTCGDAYEKCSFETAVQILKDVVYLMRRSDDEKEERVFFKIQSIGSNNIPVFQHAFPHTPWIYVYREPVQVMMSQLAQGDTRANCVKTRRRPAKASLDLMEARGRTLESLTNVEYCASHLAALTEVAAASLDQNAYPVNYKDLPAAFYDKILPAIGYKFDEAARKRMQDISKIYSKGMKGPPKEFKGDSEKKEKKATPEIRDASNLFLQASYEKLEAAVAAQRT